MNPQVADILAKATGKYAIVGTTPQYAAVVEIICLRPDDTKTMWVRDPNYPDQVGNVWAERLFGSFDSIAEAKQVIAEAKKIWEHDAVELRELRAKVRILERDQKTRFLSRLQKEGSHAQQG